MGLIVGIASIGIFVFSGIAIFYSWTYKPMKTYETRYGSTKLGDEWLKERALQNARKK